MLNGIICINKPQGFTSFDVIAKLRGILQMKKLGHAGTLDPMATGVLPVFAGKATRACDIIPNNDKSYTAGFKLGTVTNTQDITGNVISETAPNVNISELCDAALNFKGDIMQIPPMYSAVSVGGKRLYELARKGIEIERPPKAVTVYGIEISGFNPESGEGTLNISCSKGTYIRTVIHDIGQYLGCGAVMTSLVRTSSCGFSLSDCFSFDDIIKMRDENTLPSHIIPIEKVFETYPEIRLTEKQSGMYKNGVKLPLEYIKDFTHNSPKYRVFDDKNSFIGTAFPDTCEGILRVDKNFFV